MQKKYYSFTEVIAQIKNGDEFVATNESSSIRKITKSNDDIKLEFGNYELSVIGPTCSKQFEKSPKWIPLMDAIRDDVKVYVDTTTLNKLSLFRTIRCTDSYIVDKYKDIITGKPVSPTIIPVLICLTYNSVTAYDILNYCKCCQVDK